MINSEAGSCTLRSIKKIDIRKYRKQSELFSALANGTRVAILDIIMKYGEVCTCELENALDIPQPTVTVHLQKLYVHGILTKREEWKYTYYSIDKKYEKLIRSVLGYR